MVISMESPDNQLVMAKKRKRVSKPITTSNKKENTESPLRKKLKNNATKSASPVRQRASNVKPCLDHIVKETNNETPGVLDDISRRFPVLDNLDLVKKFLSVPMTNNQKGRIRQLLRDSLKGTSEFLLPDVIHNKILSILKSSDELSETELRKIRILYNMLKTAVATEKSTVDGPKKKDKKTKKKIDKKPIMEIKNLDEKKVHQNIKAEQGDVKKTMKTIDKTIKKPNKEDPKVIKPKGPKRYVVFVGNLPPDINKEQIMQHFSEFNECIVDIRIPQRPEGKKSSIAYVELKNEPTYELALSKHHSMLGSKRINVLYTTQKNGKVSKTEAKSKSAKLIALQKAGKLIGSVPTNRKRSHRRMKMKRAQAKLQAESS